MVCTSLISELPCFVSIIGKYEKSSMVFSTDSRVIKAGEVFVALAGENFDGTLFLEDCLKKGVRQFVLKKTKKNLDTASYHLNKVSDLCFYFVTDTNLFLAELAKRHIEIIRSLGRLKVIGITGSNGKTTTKEMIFHLLNTAFINEVHKTLGNYNNHIGLPLTILGLEKHHKFAILELGTNHPGEIDYLCSIAKPDSGVITSIGDAHLEFLASREGVFQEKSTLYKSISQSKEPMFVTNGDDPFLKTLGAGKGVDLIGKSFGNIRFEFSNNCKLQLTSSFGWRFNLENSNLVGEHNFLDLALAFVLCMRLAPDKEKIFLQAASNFKPENNRSELLIKNDVLIFLDAYNANPSSMETSILGFKNYITNKGLSLDKSVFIVGDMNELGEHAEEGHRKIGELLRKESISKVIFIGRYYAFFKKGYLLDAMGQFQDVKEAKDKISNLTHGASSIFVKASRSVGLESLFNRPH